LYLYAYVVSLRVCLFSHTSWHALCLRAVAHSAVAHSRRGLRAVAHTRRRARGRPGRVCVSAQTASARVCLVCVGARFGAGVADCGKYVLQCGLCGRANVRWRTQQKKPATSVYHGQLGATVCWRTERHAECTYACTQICAPRCVR